MAVLVAISIPIFTSQLEKSREATDLANLRAAKAEAVVEILDGTATAGAKYYNPSTGKLDTTASDATKVGKGTGATVAGAAYTTDAVYTQFSYTGESVVGKSIKCTFAVPTDGTEPTVSVGFAD